MTQASHRRRAVTTKEWGWPIMPSDQQHNDRVALMRPIPYEMTAAIGREAVVPRTGYALSLNLSSGGMLVLMDQVPGIEQVLKVNVPTPLPHAEIPTLAEVRWARKVPLGETQNLCFVGLKFLF